MDRESHRQTFTVSRSYTGIILGMDNSDYKSYKPRSLIFAWENDAFSHIAEARKWEAALKANAYENHQEEKMQALLNVNL